jgi:iron complex outermembrane receptor protein
LITGWGNLGTIDVEALSFDSHASYDLMGLTFNHKLRAQKQLNYEIDGINSLDNNANRPSLRANLGSYIDYDDFTATWNINMIGDTSGTNSSPSWVTQDVQFSYSADWNGIFTLGLQNMFEKKPPLNTGNTGQRAYDFDLYNAYGRITYLQYTQKF